jgi:hypothetical protein
MIGIISQIIYGRYHIVLERKKGKYELIPEFFKNMRGK